MSNTEELTRLGQARFRLDAEESALGRSLAILDRALIRLAIPFDYLHPRPLREVAQIGAGGKREIEVAYLGLLAIDGQRRLAVKTVTILESKAAQASRSRGSNRPLVESPPELLEAASGVLGELVRALCDELHARGDAAERRREAVDEALRTLGGAGRSR